MIELAVALVVVGLLMAIVATQYSKWSDFYRFSGAVSSVNAALRAARLRAIGRQLTLPFVFAPMTSDELKASGWPPYGNDNFVVRYPFQCTPASALDYGKMAFVYHPDVYIVTVNTTDGDATPDLVLNSSTDDWKRTIGFNSRGFAMRSSTNPDTPCDLNHTGYIWSQKPFKFSIKAAEVRTEAITFTVSPVGQITR